MEIKAGDMHFKTLNNLVRTSEDREVIITDCLGQRYIGAGVTDKDITIYGTPGNALGAYLTDTNITLHGNGQDATGDTMDNGEILIYGNCGDTTGYGMRGGKIIIKGNAGYRVGIHMKEYQEHKPAIVIGGKVGDFLGEYQAGGTIVVLGIGEPTEFAPVGDFCGTGMHGGAIYIRSEHLPNALPKQVSAEEVTRDELGDATALIEEYCDKFGVDKEEILNSHFFKLTPNSANPYKQLYTHN